MSSCENCLKESKYTIECTNCHKMVCRNCHSNINMCMNCQAPKGYSWNGRQYLIILDEMPGLARHCN